MDILMIYLKAVMFVINQQVKSKNKSTAFLQKEIELLVLWTKIAFIDKESTDLFLWSIG